jgi:hypothetical protein
LQLALENNDWSYTLLTIERPHPDGRHDMARVILTVPAKGLPGMIDVTAEVAELNGLGLVGGGDILYPIDRDGDTLGRLLADALIKVDEEPKAAALRSATRRRVLL